MESKAVNRDPTNQRESLTELLGQLASNSAAVVRNEIELMIQRIRERARAVRRGVLAIAVGAIISFAAFLSFCAALIIGLTSYLAPVIAALVTGAVLALAGAVIVFIGYKRLKKSISKK